MESSHGRKEVDSTLHRPGLIIVGSGPAGLNCLSSLKAFGLPISVSVLSKEVTLGAGGAFAFSAASNRNLGATAFSINLSEQLCASKLNKLKELAFFKLCDDGQLSAGRLSRTIERPQGWSRTLGQWEHYRIAAEDSREALRSLLTTVAGTDNVDNVQLGQEVLAVEPSLGAVRGWKVQVDEAVLVCSALVFAVPAGRCLALLQQMEKTCPGFLQAHVVDVVARCAAGCTVRHAHLIRVRVGRMAEMVLSQFRNAYCPGEQANDPQRADFGMPGMALELDVSEVGDRSVNLIHLANAEAPSGFRALAILGNLFRLVNPAAASTSGPITILIHTKTEVAGEPEKLVEWLASWLNMEPVDVAACVELVDRNSFCQADINVNNGHMTPLMPLRESSCIVACEDPPLVLVGDWCTGMGNFSAALISGHQGAHVMYRLLAGEVA